jgi:hypothetical protein
MFNREKLFNISPDEFEAKLLAANLCKLREIPYDYNPRCNKIPNDQIILFATTDIAKEDKLFESLVANKVTTEKLSHSYLKSIPTGRITNKGINAIRAEIEKLEARLVILEKPDSVRAIWRSELNELFKYLREKSA